MQQQRGGPYFYICPFFLYFIIEDPDSAKPGTVLKTGP